VVDEALSVQAHPRRHRRARGADRRKNSRTPTRRKAEAEKERDEFQEKNEAFDQQRAALLSQATDEAKAERQRLLEEARQAADTLSAKRQEVAGETTPAT
jgi:F0F1-type ATP synthase membrane subunit b/b'